MAAPDGQRPIWIPTQADVANANLSRFAQWLAARGHVGASAEYMDLWRWSVDDLTGFWAAVWDFFDIHSPVPYRGVLAGSEMPDVQWFDGAEVSYAGRLLRSRNPDDVALIDVRESPVPGDPPRSQMVTWRTLRAQVASVAALLSDIGVRAGDTVAAFVPNTAETVAAFLATASLGAIWAACGQDYAPAAAADRLRQPNPAVLIAADGYRYGGRPFDRREHVTQLSRMLPSLRGTVIFERLGLGLDPGPGRFAWPAADDGRELVTREVPFGHPLWVLFSSGTTGRPKGIVHSTGGVLLEHLKAMSLQLDLGEADTFFWYTSPTWMVWNYLVSGLLVGSRIVCYDGSPAYPTPNTLWEIAARHGVTLLGTSPAHLRACAAARLEPARDYDLTRLRQVGSSGSALPPDAYFWIADHVGPRVRVNSTTGGTDVVSAFAGGNPTIPVWPGELSAPCLGVALDAWDERGKPVRDAVGELVITKPMPSMPVSFWGDPDGARYRGAYFETFPGVWRHGDWITITARGSVIVHGRSDATLNRNGIRMGSSDIYRIVERFDEVAEALVIGVERPDGTYWMPLFLSMNAGYALDDALSLRIRAAIRDGASPRHVPDDVIMVSRIPHTRTGKKLEIPIKRILQGADPADAVDIQAVDDPAALQWFASYRPTAREAAQ
jgi:acetoacetyl-CoA synthetase